MFGFYNAILILMGNDVGAPSVELMLTAIVFLICGALVNANIFGTIVEVHQQMYHKEMKF